MPALSKILRYVSVFLVATLGPFVPGVGVAIYNTIFQTEIDGVDKMGAQIWASFWEWARVYVAIHWDRFLWTSAGIMGVWAIVTHGYPFIKRSMKRRILVRRVGIRAFLPRNTEQEKKESWDDCAHHLNDVNNNAILISGANGWATFGSPSSPLHDVINNFGKSVKILLVYPYSEAIEMRAANVEVDVNDYRNELVKTLSFCKKLKNRGSDIEVRLFDWPPVWKMIFSSDRLWLQHYEYGKHVDNTPAYSFDRTPDPSALYNPFRAEFTRMWERAESINLSASINSLLKIMESQHRPVACSSCDGGPAGKMLRAQTASRQ
ncbi:hypothetical protein [Azospirillum brasilense]|uniref:hypothetical protein n=1 Tax=Azospirillum brasilense TaxID=192 RepID=UPI001EDC5A78|nr:hypothetical protein [Azospirillum brasilense]UKJ74464.1 hypothetical protein H1Q64_18045 [Azospirillum brasilense]